MGTPKGQLGSQDAQSVLLESCPAFESLVDLSEPHCLQMLSELGGICTP